MRNTLLRKLQAVDAAIDRRIIDGDSITAIIVCVDEKHQLEAKLEARRERIRANVARHRGRDPTDVDEKRSAAQRERREREREEAAALKEAIARGEVDEDEGKDEVDDDANDDDDDDE